MGGRHCGRRVAPGDLSRRCVGCDRARHAGGRVGAAGRNTAALHGALRLHGGRARHATAVDRAAGRIRGHRHGAVGPPDAGRCRAAGAHRQPGCAGGDHGRHAVPEEAWRRRGPAHRKPDPVRRVLHRDAAGRMGGRIRARGLHARVLGRARVVRAGAVARSDHPAARYDSPREGHRSREPDVPDAAHHRGVRLAHLRRAARGTRVDGRGRDDGRRGAGPEEPEERTHRR